MPLLLPGGKVKVGKETYSYDYFSAKKSGGSVKSESGNTVSFGAGSAYADNQAKKAQAEAQAKANADAQAKANAEAKARGTGKSANDLTVEEARRRILQYQQTTTERRAKTDERMVDYRDREKNWLLHNPDGSTIPITENQANAFSSKPNELAPGYSVSRARQGGQNGTGQTGQGGTGQTGQGGTGQQGQDGQAPPPANDPFGVADEVASIQNEGERRVKLITDTLDRISRTQDAAYQQIVQATKRLYGERIAEMRTAGEKLLNMKEQLGIRSGRERYTPILQQGILTDEEIAISERVFKLETEMMGELAKAAQAKADGDMKRFNDAYDQIDKVEDNMRQDIQNLYKVAADQMTAINNAKKAEAEANKNKTEQMLDMSERSAPAVAKAMMDLGGSPAEQADFIARYADIMGVDPYVLWGDVIKSMSAQQKATMDIKNIESAISDRYSDNVRADNKEQREIDEKEGRTTLRMEIVKKLEDKSITIEQARNAWARAYPISEFDDEFASWIEDEI